MGAVFGLAGFASLSFHDALIKHLTASYAVPQIIFFTALFALPLLLIARRLQNGGSLIPRHPWWVALRTLGHFCAGAGSFVAFSKLPMAEVYAFLFATPLVITALSNGVLGEWVGLKRWVAVIVGMIGVLIVLEPTRSAIGLGHVAALVAMFGGAVVSLVFRRIGRTESGAAMLFYPMVLNLVVMGALLGAVHRPMPWADLALNAGVAVLGLAGMLSLYVAYRMARAATVAPMQYSQIIWAVLFGVFVFGEHPEPHVALGVALIMASGLYILLNERNGARVQQEV